jgi:hypothetical protein
MHAGVETLFETLTDTSRQTPTETAEPLDVSTDDEHEVELTEENTNTVEYTVPEISAAVPEQKTPLVPLVPVVVVVVVVAVVASVVITRKLCRRKITHRGESSWSASLDDDDEPVEFVAKFEIQA